MTRVGMMGLGNMGESIVRGLLHAGLSKNDIVGYEVKEERARAIRQAYGIEVAASAEELANRSDCIILAVKPQDAKTAIHAIGPFIGESKIILSIMAGVTTSNITSMLEKQAKVIRVMPNICIAVAEGALGITSNYAVSQDELKSVEALLSPLGSVVQVSEEYMDAITALSGSGPAFVLSFLEGMIDGGVKMGLPRDKSSVLAIQTIKGTIRMLQQEKIHPALMKEMITSPGGTTIAGLVVLEEKGFGATVVRALEAAQARAKELSK
jgi:pyrroline-5-carboxylate reductase